MKKKTVLRRLGTRTAAALVALVLTMGCAVGGTVAWLVANTDPVVNTFTYGDINLTLDETQTDEKGNPKDENNDGIPDRAPEGNEYTILHGDSYLKDPLVNVQADSEACWLFVKLEEKGGTTAYPFGSYLTYAVADGWTQLLAADGTPVTGVWYRAVDKSADAAAYPVLKDNRISVPGEVTKEMLNALDADGQNPAYPSLSITAYAVQYSGFEPAVSEGATAPDAAQTNAAALLAWQTATATP